MSTGCIECNEGQMRCVGNDAPGRCCNWYLNNSCYITCPAPLVGNQITYDCGKHKNVNHSKSLILTLTTECVELTVVNGRVNFTEQFQIGSVASYTCNEGYIPDDTSRTRTCTMDGWSGSNFTCRSKMFMFLLLLG